MGLQDLLLIVQLQWFEIRFREGLGAGCQVDRHGWPENRQALSECDDALFMEPEQRTVEKLRGIVDRARELEVASQRCHQLAQRRFDLDILAPRPVGCFLLKCRQQYSARETAELGRHG